MDKQKIDQFWQSRTAIEDPRLATNYRNDGRLNVDFEFVRRYLPDARRILDLGAGSCTLTQLLLPFTGHITAVDMVAGFFDRVPSDPKLTTHCADVATYLTPEKFDGILLFGVVNFLTQAEEQLLYKNCSEMLEFEGVFLVKNQCGMENEKIVDRFSEELACDYHARYPWVRDQEKKLEEFFQVETVDIYPSEINRWPDTHFYAFVCTHRQK
jgi:spermidine synthase